MTQATVAMPWRATPDRRAAFDRCRKFWETNEYPVVCADSGPKRKFNRSAARNRAVVAAETEVVVVADADTIPDNINQIRYATDLAAEGVVVWPYDRYRLLPAEAVTVDDLADVEPIREYPINWRPASITVIRRNMYELVGGFDEKFGHGWGYEDSAFAAACRTFAETVTLSDVVYAFDHHAQRRRDPHNSRRFGWYKRAEGKPDDMRRLIKWTG